MSSTNITLLLDNSQDVVLSHDQIINAIQSHVSAAVFGKEYDISFLNLQFDPFAFNH